MSPDKKPELSSTIWVIKERIPGYFGKSKDAIEAGWNNQFGEGNWRLAWQIQTGKVLDFDQVFWTVYVPGYEQYFLTHLNEAEQLVGNYSYAYDKELISKAEAFDPHALYQKPRHPNQFHHVALNIALERELNMPFRGTTPIQVREGKPGTPVETWPLGYKWGPGRIPATQPDWIPTVEIPADKIWWQPKSIEDLYQRSKILQIKR